MKVSKLRKKLTNKKYVEKLYKKFSDKAEKWHNFEKWECSDFFVGYEKAKYNQRKHDEAMAPIGRHIEFLEKLLK